MLTVAVEAITGGVGIGGSSWCLRISLITVTEGGAWDRRRIWIRKGWSRRTTSGVTNSSNTWSRLVCKSWIVRSKEKMVAQVVK